jgi:hypothetical protein
MFTIVHRTFLMTAAVAFSLISPLVSAKTASGTTLSTREQQHMRHQQVEDDVSANFKEKDPPTLGFDIEVETSNDPGWIVSDTFKSYFNNAIEKWQTIITGDLRDVSTGSRAGYPTLNFTDYDGNQLWGTCTYPEMIDDLWICASAGNFGGFDSDDSILLGYATVETQRLNNGLPVTGLIAFNNDAQGVVPADVLQDTATHEIGHAVSVSSLFVFSMLFFTYH